MKRTRLGVVMAVVGIAVTAWVAPVIGVRATTNARVTADEPQYLMTAISLGEDGDLNIHDERRDLRHRVFHEKPLPVQELPQPDGTRISPHDPLLPLLLATSMNVGGWIAAKLTLAAFAGLLAAALLWVAVRRFAIPLVIAVVTVGAFSAAAPLAFYGTQVYPELPAALAVTAAIAALTGSLRARGVTLLALAVAALPWLSVKYAPVAVTLAAIGLGMLWRRGRRRDATAVVVVLAAAGVGYLWAHQVLYGGWTVYAAGDHFIAGEAGVIGSSPNYVGRAQRLLGLLTDREFGLAAWQPAFLLAIPALVALVRRRPARWTVLALPLAAGWLNATFVALTMHGWWWPGRQVVVVLPCVVLAVAWWVHAYAPARAWLAAAAALGLLSYAWLTTEGLLGHRSLVVGFADTTNPWYRLWSLVLPDNRLVPAGTAVLRSIWLAAAAALALWGWRSVRPASAPISVMRARAPSPALVTASSNPQP